MGFTVRNEGFVCSSCGEKNPPAAKTCRNHCRQCFCSEHVDLDTPGDRASACYGKMVPKQVEPEGKRGWMITHVCEKCGKVQRNKAAADDNFEKLLEIAKTSADDFWKGK